MAKAITVVKLSLNMIWRQCR